MLSIALEWLTAAALGALAIWTVRDWVEHRDAGRRAIAAAATLLAGAATLYPLDDIVAQVTATVAFLGAGYALLALRDFLLPLPRRARLALILSAPIGGAASVYIAVAEPASLPLLYWLASLIYLGIWLSCTGEPIVRFWSLSRTRPAVQRARLRALSAGYAAAIAVLLLQFLEIGVSLPTGTDMVFELLAAVIVAILAAGLAPPAWLRRLWGAREQDAATRATQELLNAAPGVAQLAGRGLEWSARLVGAEQGFVIDEHGSVLATYGMDGIAAQGIARTLDVERCVGMLPTHHSAAGTVLCLPLQDEGTLVLRAGPFTPVFGSDELSRLQQYSVGLTAALQRERLAEQLRRNTREVEHLNRDLEARVVERTRTLRRDKHRTATILAAIADAVLTASPEGHVIGSNRAGYAMFGLDATSIEAGVELTDLVTPEYGDVVRAHVERLEHRRHAGSGFTEAKGRSRTGGSFAMEFRLDAVETDGERLLILCARDVSERERYIDQLEYQALHDPLTGLPNRALFADRVTQAVQSCERNAGACTVLIVDLDRFKEVNDTLGHSAGDALLQQVADRFRSRLRPSDTLARLGADEFGVLLTGVRHKAATLTAQRLASTLRDPVQIDQQRIHVVSSIGIAGYPLHSRNAEGLLQRAAAAMYAAKREHTPVATYSESRDVDRPLRLTVQGDLASAMARDELTLHYQPIIAVGSGELTGVEALVRWQHPRLGLLPPDRFIPALEESGLIQDLGHWVVRASVDALRACRDVGLDVVMAVNISARSLNDLRLPDVVRDAVASAGVPAERLRLEVTESAAVSDVSEAVLADLRGLGVLFAIDDFGTGHSSLTRLRHLPVAEVKVDRSFVAGLGSRDEDEAIVRTTINLAHSLGLEVVAEGVETARVLDELAAMSCDQAQGFFIARPMPLHDLLNWHHARRRSLAGERSESVA